MEKVEKKAFGAEQLAKVIAYLLLIQAIILAQNSIIWVLTGDDTDKWFSRLTLSLICFGFSGVIFILQSFISKFKQ